MLDWIYAFKEYENNIKLSLTTLMIVLIKEERLHLHFKQVFNSFICVTTLTDNSLLKCVFL